MIMLYQLDLWLEVKCPHLSISDYYASREIHFGYKSVISICLLFHTTLNITWWLRTSDILEEDTYFQVNLIKLKPQSQPHSWSIFFLFAFVHEILKFHMKRIQRSYLVYIYLYVVLFSDELEKMANQARSRQAPHGLFYDLLYFFGTLFRNFLCEILAISL